MMTRTAAGVAGLAALGLPESVWARQDGDEPVTFTDYTDAFKIHASASRPQVRCVDLRPTTSTTPSRRPPRRPWMPPATACASAASSSARWSSRSTS
jgi:hypothetical protein